MNRASPIGLSLLTAAAVASACASSTPAPEGGDLAGADARPERPPRRPGAPAPASDAGARHLEAAEKLAAPPSNDLEGAIRECRAAIAEDPRLEKAYLLLGSACSQRGGRGRGRAGDDCELAAYEDGLKALPDSAAILDARGLVRVEAGDLKGALGDLEHATSLDPRDAKIMADLSYAYALAGRLKDAEALARRARAADPRSFEAAMALGEVLIREKDGKRAGEAFEAARALAGKDDPEVLRDITRKIAVARALDGDDAKALELFEQVLAESKRSDPLLEVQIAGELMKLDRPKEAVKHMQSAVRESPDDPRYLGLLLQTQEKAGDKKGAQATRKRLAALGAKP